MSWQNFGTGSTDLDQLQALIDSVTDPVQTALGVVDVSLSALDLGRVLLVSGENITATTLTAAVNTLQQAVGEILECNVSAMVHLNTNWDPTWTVEKLEDSGDMPWTGTGLRGWVRDVAASLHDTSDPLRPLTDADTEVWGLLFVVGIPNAGTVENLVRLGQAFGRFDDFTALLSKEKLQAAAADYRALSRLGPAFMDPTVQGAVGSKSAMAEYVKAFAADGSAYIPYAGNYPHWYSLPLTAVVPAADGVFQGLRNVVSGLRPPVGHLRLVEQLVAALRLRVAYLRKTIEQVDEAAALLIALTTFLSNASIYVIKTKPGEGKGIAGVLAEAAADPTAPNFGTDGLVAGIGFFATAGTPQAPFEAFWSMLGLQAGALADDTTIRAENLEQMYGDLFPP